MALLTACCLFVSVLLHGTGPFLVAMPLRRQGPQHHLFLLGGVATVERECSTACQPLQVAAARPLVSLGWPRSCLLGSHSVVPCLGPWR